ncbi:MAG: DUF1488 family protein [Proteobacteria bacterium]|nr:DUF1488 family protein [Pseudomonadota bacterium]
MRAMIDFGRARNMRWVGEAKEVQFSVEVGNRDILCRVSQEANGNHLGEDPRSAEEYLDAAKESFDSITNRVGRKILLRQFEPDGSVLLRTEDLMGP